MDNTIEFLTNKEDIEKRLDVFLSKKMENITRSNIKKIIEGNKVKKINHKIVNSPAKKIKKNDLIIVNFLPEKSESLLPSKIDLDIQFEDKDILVINKPKGMVVHPGSGNKINTLANALSYKFKDNLSNLNGKLRPGIVHRIDKDTSVTCGRKK